MTLLSRLGSLTETLNMNFFTTMSEETCLLYLQIALQFLEDYMLAKYQITLSDSFLFTFLKHLTIMCANSTQVTSSSLKSYP